MRITRKKYVVDKKFQIGLSVRAVLLPLTTTLAICAMVLVFSGSTNRIFLDSNDDINAIIDTQEQMLDMFMSIPALQNQNSPIAQKYDKIFKENLAHMNEIHQNHARIKKNIVIVIFILIAMTLVQAAIIFFQFIFFSHKISGPLLVMTRYLRELRKGNRPELRSLRGNDELKEFYNEFNETIRELSKN